MVIYFDILLHTLVCVEGRKLNDDQWFKVVFSSLKNVPKRCCSHSASKIFAHAKKSLTFANELSICRGFVH